MVAWAVNVAGLGSSVAGAVLLFFGTPPDLLGTTKVTWATVRGSASGDAAKALRARRSVWGIALVGAGFVLQLVVALAQFPVH